MRFGDACLIKYCRAKKATEKVKIHAGYKVLTNVVNMETKQAKKLIYYQDLLEKDKTNL